MQSSDLAGRVLGQGCGTLGTPKADMTEVLDQERRFASRSAACFGPWRRSRWTATYPEGVETRRLPCPGPARSRPRRPSSKRGPQAQDNGFPVMPPAKNRQCEGATQDAVRPPGPTPPPPPPPPPSPSLISPELPGRVVTWPNLSPHLPQSTRETTSPTVHTHCSPSLDRSRVQEGQAVPCTTPRDGNSGHGESRRRPISVSPSQRS